MAEKPFVTEKYQDKKFSSLRDYLDFILLQKKRISNFALGAPGPTSKATVDKKEGNEGND